MAMTPGVQVIAGKDGRLAPFLPQLNIAMGVRSLRKRGVTWIEKLATPKENGIKMWVILKEYEQKYGMYNKFNWNSKSYY